MGYEYHLDSALVKPTQERWLKLQDLILLLKSKRVLTARCLMSLIGLLASTEKMVPEGRLHRRPFQFHLKEHWRYLQSLDNLLPWTEAIAAHLDWWQNPSNVMKGADLHPKHHSIQLFTISNSLPMLITRLLLVLEVWDGEPTYRKSWAGNLLVWSDLTLGLFFKVKRA